MSGKNGKNGKNNGKTQPHAFKNTLAASKDREKAKPRGKFPTDQELMAGAAKVLNAKDKAKATTGPAAKKTSPASRALPAYKLLHGTPKDAPLAVRFSARAWFKIMFMTRYADTECSFYCTVNEDMKGLGETRVFSVGEDDVYVPAQTNTGADTEFDDAPDKGKEASPGNWFAIIHEIYKKDKDGPEKLKLWVHTHHDGGVFWSGKDQTNIERLSKDMPFLLSIVVNQQGQVLSRMDTHNPFRIVFDSFPVYAEELWYTDLAEEMRKTYDARASEGHFSFGLGGAGYANGGYADRWAAAQDGYAHGWECCNDDLDAAQINHLWYDFFADCAAVKVDLKSSHGEDMKASVDAWSAGGPIETCYWDCYSAMWSLEYILETFSGLSVTTELVEDYADMLFKDCCEEIDRLIKAGREEKAGMFTALLARTQLALLTAWGQLDAETLPDLAEDCDMATYCDLYPGGQCSFFDIPEEWNNCHFRNQLLGVDAPSCVEPPETGITPPSKGEDPGVIRRAVTERVKPMNTGCDASFCSSAPYGKDNLACHSCSRKLCSPGVTCSGAPYEPESVNCKGCSSHPLDKVLAEGLIDLADKKTAEEFLAANEKEATSD